MEAYDPARDCMLLVKISIGEENDVNISRKGHNGKAVWTSQPKINVVFMAAFKKYRHVYLAFTSFVLARERANPLYGIASIESELVPNVDNHVRWTNPGKYGPSFFYVHWHKTFDPPVDLPRPLWNARDGSEIQHAIAQQLFMQKKKRHVEVEYETNDANKRRAAPKVYEWKSFERPKPPLPAGEEMVLMIMSPDYNVERGNTLLDGLPKENADAGQSVPVVRLFCLTNDERPATALVRVHRFWPYFFVGPPPDMDLSNVASVKRSLDQFRLTLADLLPRRKHEIGIAIHSIELTRMQHALGYRRDDEQVPLLKISFMVPSYVASARKILESGSFRWQQDFGSRPHEYQCYEGNVPFVVRYLLDAKLTGASWFRVHKWVSIPNPKSKCQIEVDVHWQDIEPIPIDSDLGMRIPRVRILSFDIVSLFIFSLIFSTCLPPLVFC